MSKFEQDNRNRSDEDYDFQELSYILPPQGPFADAWKSCDRGDEALGEVRKPEVFETEHHVYTTPFNYENVELREWCEGHAPKGPEFLPDIGSITITEEQPIVEVVVVGSGCSGNNYNMVEWWGEGENIRNAGLMKRQRVGNLQGQHPAWIQNALRRDMPDFQTLDEARAFIRKLQRIAHAMTSNYTQPGSMMTGLYENTVHFRIGDTSRPELTAHKVVVSGGGLDYEDPHDDRNRYPADYVFRMIDVIVRKPARG